MTHFNHAMFSAILSTTVACLACGSPDDLAMAEASQPLLIVPGADLRITAFSQTSQTYVDGFQQFSVTVANSGSADSNPTTLAITLLETQTSPQTYLLGSLQAVPSGCSLSGRTLTCALGRLRYNGPMTGRRRTVTFGYKIPVTTQALALTASASGTGEPPANATDNTAALNALVDYRPVTVTPGTKTSWHCTGTTLSAYFECTKFPSSITSHEAQFHANGTISFAGQSVYTGTWVQPSPTELHFEYSNGSYVEAVFDGFGADTSCFEGITRFYEDSNPNDTIPPVLSAYRSPYRTCF